VSPIDDEELDRLADYAAGLLDPGTALRVRERIDADPAWGEAYAALRAAQPRLDRTLSGLADPPLPADVADRLSAALAREGSADDPRAPDAGTGAVVDLAARRRRRRPAALLGAAAAVLAVVFGGVVVLSNLTSQSQNSGGTAASRPDAATGQQLSGGLTIRHTGIDYSPATLPGADPRTPAMGVPAPAKSGVNGARTADGGSGDTSAPAGLDRLADPTALQACLAAITQRYGGPALIVDYARYQGAPALIVVVAAGETRRIVVAGPGCGLSGVGIDERYSAAE